MGGGRTRTQLAELRRGPHGLFPRLQFDRSGVIVSIQASACLSCWLPGLRIGPDAPTLLAYESVEVAVLGEDGEWWDVGALEECRVSADLAGRLAGRWQRRGHVAYGAFVPLDHAVELLAEMEGLWGRWEPVGAMGVED